MFKINEQKIEEQENSLSFFISPWDTEIFGFKVLNVKKINIKENAKTNTKEIIINLISRLDTFCLQNEVKVIFWKVDATNTDLISLMQDYKYKYVEMSVTPYMNCEVSDENFLSSFCKNEVRKAGKDDIKRIKEIAKVSFKNDRFHKDEKFDNFRADERYAFWVENSFNAGEDIFIIMYNGEIAGFIIVNINEKEKKAELKLFAIEPKFQGKKLAYDLHARIILMLKEKKINILPNHPVSVANVGSFYLYTAMGFKFTSPMICFHKWV